MKTLLRMFNLFMGAKRTAPKHENKPTPPPPPPKRVHVCDRCKGGLR